GGILTNILTDGRPPVRSGPMSDEQKEAIRRGNTGKKRTPEQSAYLSLIRKGKTRGPCSEETKEKIRLANIAAKAEKKISDDLTNKQFGSWLVIEKGRDLRPKIRGSNGIFWKCRCLCGIEKEVQQTLLIKGRSTNC